VVIHSRRGRRHCDRGQRGATILEMVIAATLFAGMSVSICAAGATFSDVLAEQFEMQETYTSSNVTRMRFLGDADSSTAVSCAAMDRLSFTLGGSPGIDVEYYIDSGELVRWADPPDKTSLVASGAATLDCIEVGPDDVYAVVALGTTEHPYYLLVHVTSS